MSDGDGGHPTGVSAELLVGDAGAVRSTSTKDVKLEELSKYFHLPEKAVAKELGICLTSLKKLCRSYGITRWPFRKLKSLERTMRKVQTESQVINGGALEGSLAVPGNATAGDSGGGSKAVAGGAGEVKRMPFQVGNQTVFLSEEELSVFQMTMGKEAAPDQYPRPTPLGSLDPGMLNTATMSAASLALANVARVAAPSAAATMVGGDGYGAVVEAPPIAAEVQGSTLVITNWSTMWSQPQIQGKLLYPLGGTRLRVSEDGVTAVLHFHNPETAARALRICKLAEAQALQTHSAGHAGAHGGASARPMGAGTSMGVPAVSGREGVAGHAGAGAGSGGGGRVQTLLDGPQQVCQWYHMRFLHMFMKMIYEKTYVHTLCTY